MESFTGIHWGGGCWTHDINLIILLGYRPSLDISLYSPKESMHRLVFGLTILFAYRLEFGRVEGLNVC